MAWNPGIPAEFHIGRTVCATADAATYGNDSRDATAHLQGLIDNCPAGQVGLSAGGNLPMSDTLRLDRAITLRGAGPG